jgi:DNA-binding transcriptional LysR family regulator
MANPDLNAVRIFVEVIAAGSLRGAARQLALPRSTVGRKLAELERALGVRLVNRTARAVALTAEGAAYLAQVGPAIEAITEADHAVGAVGSRATGTLRLTAPPTYGERYLVPIIARYVERYPEVRVNVDLSDRHVDLIGEGFDLAIRAGTLDEPDLVRRRIGDAATAVIAAPGYLRARGAPDHPAELASHDCLILTSGPAAARWTFDERGAPIEVNVRGRIGSLSWAFLRGAAVAGLGIARLPTFYVADDLAAGRLVPLVTAFTGASSSLFVVYPAAPQLPARTRAFIDLLVEHAATPGAPPPPDRQPRSRVSRSAGSGSR